MARERLYGLKEIAAATGVRAATLSAWQARGNNGMPPPDQRLGAGPVWFAATIEPWIASLGRRPDEDAPALREDVLRRVLRRHLRATALLLEEPPRRPTLIAHALKDLERVGADCARAASEARGPLARALRAEADLIGELDPIRSRTEREMSRAGSERRSRRAVSPDLDRSHRRLSGLLVAQAASLSAAIGGWLDADAPDRG